MDLGVSAAHAFIAMEYFPRGDLRAHISKGMTAGQALDAVSQMAHALEVVHEVGVLHRDLKPGNVMVRANGSFALIDFGLAKQREIETGDTAAGHIFGTPYYMSPEQGHGRELDARSDLYSLGVILYEMLTGKKPFVAAKPMTVLYMHANAPRPELAPELSAYQPLLDRLIAADPDQRYGSASELLTALHMFREL
jgi:serine/threonine protein kinase